MPEPPGLAPISQIPPRRRSRSPSVPGRGHPCPICHEIFNTVRGLGVHHAAKHRAQRDQQITQERQNITKARWDPEERHLLAEKEAELTKKGVKLLNRELREAFPHRSLEAIKGQRRTPAHKTLVADLLQASLPGPSQDNQPMPEPPPEPDSGPEPEPPRPEPASASWRRAIIVALGESRHPDDESNRAWRSDLVAEALELLDIDRPDDTSNYLRIAEIMNTHAEAVKPPGMISTRRRTRSAPPTLTARRKRRAEYAMIQTAYRKDRKRCVQAILSGNWKFDLMTAQPRVSKEAQERYWGPLFSRESPDDQRPVVAVRAPQWDVVLPITETEVKQTVKSMRTSSAAGPDGITVRLLRSCPARLLTQVYNLWLLTGVIPTALKHARTTLIPKTPDAAEPAKFRPITVASTMVRAFTKIMASRAAEACPLGPEQRAFIRADGAAENTTLLETVIRSSEHQRQPLSIAWLDVAKAFDSVSHATIVRCAKRAGLPPPALELIRSLYQGATTELRRGCHIQTTRGVRQGDPWSPWLFNAVVDEVTAPIIQAGAVSDVPPVMAFADDLVVLARNPLMLENRIEAITTALEHAGLSIHPAKCQTSIVKVDGKRKIRYVDTHTRIMVKGQPLPNLGNEGSVKYLGIEFSARGIKRDTGVKIEDQLAELKKAPLKPHQRMTILRDHILPGAQHTLVLGDMRRATLRRLDQVIRAAVRGFLHLPKDTPSAFIHAHPADGGLGIPELRYLVPLRKTQRLEALTTSRYQPLKDITRGEAFRMMVERSRPAMAVGGQALDSKERIRDEHRRQLLGKVDGAGLREAPNHPPSHRWVTTPNPPMPSAAYVGAIQIRGNLAATGQRGARSRRGQGYHPCDAGCGRPETLGHISQTCTRTHLNRTARHDRALNQLEGYLRDAGATTIKEPAIPTPAGLRKPDLLVRTEANATIVDVQIVSDHAELAKAHQRKVKHYDTEIIKEEARSRLNTSHTVEVTSATLNWRGCWAKESIQVLKTLGVSDKQLAQISIRILENTYTILKVFRTTGRGALVRGRRTRPMTGHPP